MLWQEAKHVLKEGNRIEAQHGGFGYHPGTWSEVYEIKGPVGFGSSAIMVRLKQSSGYILIPRSAKYRIKNPLPVGRSKSCRIRRLRNGKYQVRI